MMIFYSVLVGTVTKFLKFYLINTIYISLHNVLAMCFFFIELNNLYDM